ncbi:MAG: hypothetical protein FWF84_05755 [Kiritimatiellaeota bacterium]|nr:hypothetical protein [Kiritimatiellota bacterium]
MSDILDKVENSVVFQNKAASRATSVVSVALEYIDSGKFFRTPVKWLYILIALLNVCFPFYLLYWLIKLLNTPYIKITAWQGIVMLLAWAIFLAGGIVVALLWWKRKDQLSALTAAGDDFPVTPIFAHLLRTSGEMFGFYVGVVFCLISLLIMVLASSSDIGQLVFGGLVGNSVVTVLSMPVIGYLIILVSRFLSEGIYALAATASNTKKIAAK